MSRSKYKIYNGKSLKKIFENSRVFLITAMFVFGSIAGSAIIESDTIITERISLLFDTYSSIRAEQGIINNFFNSFAINGLFIIVNIFLGFSLIGCPFLTVLPVLKGLGIGAVCGYLYSSFKLTGFGYSVLMIYPGAIVSVFAFIVACNDSFEYSRNAYLKAIKGRGQLEKDETRVYLTRQLVFLGISAVSSCIDAVFCEIFSRFFQI